LAPLLELAPLRPEAIGLLMGVLAVLAGLALTARGQRA
jgi:hypothetical protein